MRRLDRCWFPDGDSLEGVRDGYYALAAAILRQAAKDALDPEVDPVKRLDARLFLASEAATWFECLGLGEIGAQNVLYLLTESKKASRVLAKAEEK